MLSTEVTWSVLEPGTVGAVRVAVVSSGTAWSRQLGCSSHCMKKCSLCSSQTSNSYSNSLSREASLATNIPILEYFSTFFQQLVKIFQTLLRRPAISLDRDNHKSILSRPNRRKAWLRRNCCVVESPALVLSYYSYSIRGSGYGIFPSVDDCEYQYDSETQEVTIAFWKLQPNFALENNLEDTQHSRVGPYSALGGWCDFFRVEAFEMVWHKNHKGLLYKLTHIPTTPWGS